MLREVLGDPRLELRFFLPESAVYVDAQGVPRGRRARRRTAYVFRSSAPAQPLGDRAARPSKPPRPANCSRRSSQAGGLAIEIARLRVELRRQLDGGRGLARADRRGRRRGAAPDRTRPARRRAAAPRLASGSRCATRSTSSTPAPRSTRRATLDEAVAEIEATDRRAARARPRAAPRPARRGPRRRAARARRRAPLPVEVERPPSGSRRRRGRRLLHRLRGADQRRQARPGVQDLAERRPRRRTARGARRRRRRRRRGGGRGVGPAAASPTASSRRAGRSASTAAPAQARRLTAELPCAS